MPTAVEHEEGVEDMITLGVLNEESILRNLKVRYAQEKIYTYTGSILVAVNPYKMFNIYGLDMVKRYEGQPLGELPPHLFAVGSASYGKMMKDTENQVIVISGESGAGKTESTKLVMQYLAAVNRSGNNLITEQILEANPLLESFGNAKTIRNDNSSRFGKYIEVFFKRGSIVGARTSEYLLEKSRIVTQAPGERNYHVFYEMLAALSPEQKGKFGLQEASRYFYLNQGGDHKPLPGRDDAENYRKLTGAMDILGFQRKEQDTILRILASVLHIGNVYFNAQQVDNHDTVVLGSEAELKWISYLLQLSEDWLKQALTSKVTEARGDRVISPYNLDQALDARDAIAKALYSRLFTWLVERINHIVCRAERERSTSLALLDIFGFEDFLVNSFEQLCINYANETLQFFFNQHIFRLEQKEYTKEKIRWQHIDFRDNQATLDLIASKPAGLLHILDDESNFPQSTDHSFLEKCHFHHAGNVLYEKPRMSDPHFFITHYAGKIKYNVSHFLEKNKDTLRSDVVELLCESKNEMISQMFNEMRDRHITKTLSKTTGRYVTLKPRTSTVSASFNESLLSLIDTMSRCNPFFIRCIKPNARKAAMEMDDVVVMEQLRYTGMLETIRIRKMGYPIRVKFPTFIERYRCLSHGRITNQLLPSEACARILETMGRSLADQYQIGATKVFMKETFEQHLDEAATRIQRDAAIRIQKCTRAYLARVHFLRIQRSVLQVQRMLRMWISRKRFLVVRRGIVRAQAQFRMFRQRRRYKQVREEIRRRLEQEQQARRQQEAQHKMEREQRERAAKAAASVANLEVPGQLAFIYSKLDDWQHQVPHILTAVGDVRPMDMEYQLPPDLNAHVFSKYTSVYFKNPNWGVQSTPLKAPLTPVQGKDIASHALSVFQLILRFMMDQTMTEGKEKILADFIVHMGLQHESLRDEILCQIVNQTWQNQNLRSLEQAWLLMAMCLSCFSPSPTLFKYLLKYVSDVGLDGYKWVCQHKALQCANVEAQLCRVYPPCLLEWRAARGKANMALEVTFPDNVNSVGHIESWTSGELFTSHLLRDRGLSDNCHGWTVVLVEEVDSYELMGYDYVLDLISELELPPGFPARSAFFLVSSDRSQEHLASRRTHHSSHPHSAERERVLVFEGQMPELIPSHAHSSSGQAVVTTKEHMHVTSSSSSHEQRTTSLATLLNGHSDSLALSMTSKLNERPTEINSSGLANNRLNNRYRKRQAPAPPVTMNGHHVNGFANGVIQPIPEDENELELSHTRLNRRYGNEESALTPAAKEELSGSKLNSRYKKVASRLGRGAGGAGGAREQIERSKAPPAVDARSIISDQSDWSHWVEDVFSLALKDDDDLSDAKDLEPRIKGGGKGGGKGVPGIQVPQQSTVPMGLPLGMGGLPPSSLNLPLQQPVLGGAISNAGFASSIGAQQDPLQMSQQVTQQQAILQAYLSQLQQQQSQQSQQAALQAALQQQQQQQSQQAALQAALQQQQQQQQQSQQQTAQLRAALQQQELQNMLLKQSIEAERLKQQLQQLQITQSLSPTSLTSSFNSAINLPPEMMAAPPASMAAASSSMSQGITLDKPGPKKVQYIKSSFENRQTSTTFSSQPQSFLQQRQPFAGTSTAHVTMATGSHSHGKGPPPPIPEKPHANNAHAPPPPPPPPLPSSLPPAPPPPPPPPPSQTVTSTSFREEIVSPRLHGQPAQPPAPPPPLPVNGPETEEEEEGGTYTFTDTKGRARTVRIGRVVWPPPQGNEKKKAREVGKLEIDENVAESLKRIGGGNRRWQKPAPAPQKEGEPQPKSILRRGNEGVQKRAAGDKGQAMRRAKSLVESSEHMETLKLLEMKLGGKGTSSAQTASQEPARPSRPAPTSAPPAPPPPASENIYATRIDADIPPPLPSRPPPPLPMKSEEIQTEEIEDTIYMTRIIPDVGPHHGVEEEPIYQSRILPDTDRERGGKMDYAALERVITELFPQHKETFLMYNRVPWKLHVRKEVFWPKDKLDNSMALHLIFCQIVQDVYNNGCIRISKEDRVKMRGMLEGYGITRDNYLTREFRTQVKKIIVDTAKEWPTYFCRLFPVAATGHHSNVQYLGVSHTGLRLVCRERSLVDDRLTVLEEIRFEDVVDVVLPTSTTIQLNLKTKSIMFYSPRSRQMKDMVDRFCTESEKGNKYVVAVKDYVTRESTLLSFHRGDIIKLMDPEMHLDDGWQYGCLNGVVGLFPAEYIKPLARHEVETTSVKPQLVRYTSREAHTADDRSETSQGTVVADGKFSMIEFAMLHFRESLDKRTSQGAGAAGSGDWTWKEQSDLVKWTRSPIQASLLRLSSPDLNKMALECFIAIMQFMGDYPMSPGQTDFDCVLKVLRCCHKYPDLRDEIFCQLCKQTTNNRSMKMKSAIRGWRLFALVAAYCDCSDKLRPYLFKYLETTAADASRTYSNAAALCLQNLRKTLKYGGRKNVPLREEVQALADGRNCKRFPYIYSGSDQQGGMLQVRSCTVVLDCIEEICRVLHIVDPVEMEEYTLFIRSREGGFYKLTREDYILDVTAEYVRKKLDYDLIFQRMVWFFPMVHLDNEVYVDMMFQQSIPDYLDGLLVMMQGGQLSQPDEEDIVILGALLHKIQGHQGIPTLKQLQNLLPRNVLGSNLPVPKPQQWLNRIHDRLQDMIMLSPVACQAKFLEILSQWKLFGSTFFLIKSIPNFSGSCMLAINKAGIFFLRNDTHEIISHHPFSEILSTRRYRSDSNVNFLDMKIGNLMVQRITRIETDQGSDISHLIGQYMNVINRDRKRLERTGSMH